MCLQRTASLDSIQGRANDLAKYSTVHKSSHERDRIGLLVHPNIVAFSTYRYLFKGTYTLGTCYRAQETNILYTP